MGVLSELEPRDVFSYFEYLSSVPHGSGSTKQISDLCVRIAKERGLRCRQDGLNNVVIRKDASPGYEGAAPVILQGHLDMVCAKDDGCPIDMAHEAIRLCTDGVSVWAEGTSLGADNGAAVAMILAVLADDSLPHPPLEAVFTVDEEVGMDGAAGLDCSDLRGRRLLNIDSEEEGVFTVSCAGGLRLDCFLPLRRQPLSGGACYTLTLDGLLGGHSGVEIDRGRANANHVMGRVLYMARAAVPSLRVADVRGGQFDNVICPLCEAKVAVAEADAPALARFVGNFEAVLQNEYASSDPGLRLSCAPCAADAALDAADTEKLLNLLFLLPQGVQARSLDIPGLTETSLNLGTIALEDDGLYFTESLRSSVETRKELLRRKIAALVSLAGGTLTERGRYPSWQYRRQSALRELVLDAWRDVSGTEGRIDATHGGLECGLFMGKLPGLDAISFGPELHDVHSPRERMDVASVGRTYALLREILRRCTE
ncbi:MAG: aminoacyl-histidine dipeptidase [Oscillospiraceae bacterium]|nr:aminoacyl-histidine dipeptidase [Oscillospiraceae bacterium]